MRGDGVRQAVRGEGWLRCDEDLWEARQAGDNEREIDENSLSSSRSLFHFFLTSHGAPLPYFFSLGGSRVNPCRTVSWLKRKRMALKPLSFRNFMYLCVRCACDVGARLARGQKSTGRAVGWCARTRGAVALTTLCHKDATRREAFPPCPCKGVCRGRGVARSALPTQTN